MRLISSLDLGADGVRDVAKRRIFGVVTLEDGLDDFEVADVLFEFARNGGIFGENRDGERRMVDIDAVGIACLLLQEVAEGLGV